MIFPNELEILTNIIKDLTIKEIIESRLKGE